MVYWYDKQPCCGIGISLNDDLSTMEEDEKRPGFQGLKHTFPTINTNSIAIKPSNCFPFRNGSRTSGAIEIQKYVYLIYRNGG